MGKKEECKSLPDGEEGEASKVVFNHFNSNQKHRIWTMQDLSKYPISRNYTSGLYNLAWAQAVQNKPLDEVLVMDFKSSSTDNPSSKHLPPSIDDNNTSDASVNTLDNNFVIEIDDDDDDEVVARGEKEEGELEEGEIDLDSEVEVVVLDSNVDGNSDKNYLDVSMWDSDTNEDVQQKVNLIRTALETVTADNALKSFDGVCSTLKNVVDKLRDLFVENSFPAKETLIQLCYSAFQTVNSVYSSTTQTQKQHNREVFLRLLGHVRAQKPQLFPHEQVKEIEDMLSPLDSCMHAKASDNYGEMLIAKKVNQNDSDSSAEKAHQDLTASNKCLLEPSLSKSLNQNDPRTLLESLKSGLTGAKGRGLLFPLLDLHKDHDADSLPSPTRDSLPCLPMHKQLTAMNGIVKADLSTRKGISETGNPKLHLYENEALKAVSSYQQKFGRSSFIVNDRLPSPTPSEEGNVGDVDIGGEVSSSSNVDNINSLRAPVLVQGVVSSAPRADVSDSRECSWTYSVVRASAKRRDPRLQFANPDGGSFTVSQRTPDLAINEPKLEQLGGILNSRKQKTLDEPAFDGPAYKRQRNELTDSGVDGDVQAVYGSGGWLEDRETVGLTVTNINHLGDNTEGDTRRMETTATGSGTTNVIPNRTIQGNDIVQITDCSTAASLHSLLKDIAVNPAMWMNLIKMEHQKSVDSAKGTTQPTSSSSLLGAVPAINNAPSKPSGSGQRSAGIVLTPPQTASMDKSGKIRIKPRDPRRVLHSNAFHKGGNLVPDQSKASALSFNGQNHAGQPDKLAVSFPSITPPDIARQFTKKLKNIADIMYVSQASTTPLVVPEISLSQPMQMHPSKANVKGASGPGNQQSGTVASSEEVIAGPCRSQNSWDDVEHLFEGFDDKQKAAIQKERARRIEEQKKLFAAHKLCLVLDLDHTLLNSAKFSEVDPVHDEMLRKKEEQDREKTQRHLFRFPNMGMWTKLRPGIWNFLEKVSKLYELHLYTMGNKLYATEMAKLLDPKGNLFAGRVISRGDDGEVLDGEERVPKSKDLEGVLGMESGVVIIDDSLRVWPHHKLNLIVVERYMYFPCSRRQFGLFGPSLLEIDHDERPEDGTLASSLAVVERMHQNFFSHQSLDEVDVRNILALEQQKILAGCRIVFSRVFPVGEVNPHLHPVWQTAEQFGAICTNQIDDNVTHVVANSLGTDKVNWALSTGRHVVHPGWVEASALLYRRANEHDFAIKP